MDQREQFKLLAAGKYAMLNINGTIDIPTMLVFVEGAIYAYDLLNKELKKSEDKIKKLEMYHEGIKPRQSDW
jgi:hypothetical protein